MCMCVSVVCTRDSECCGALRVQSPTHTDDEDDDAQLCDGGDEDDEGGQWLEALQPVPNWEPVEPQWSRAAFQRCF